MTGAFGFLGGQLTRHLVLAGAEVTALDVELEERPSLLGLSPEVRSRVTVVAGDVTDAALVERLFQDSTFDYVFHFAAYASNIQRAARSPLAALEVSAMGVAHLLDAIRRSRSELACFVLASTDKVYGESNGALCDEVSTPLLGIGVYEASKVAADLFARSFARSYHLPVAVLRMCNIFGPYDLNGLPYRLVPRTMHCLLRPDRTKPEVYRSSCHHRRDYLYVDDCCRAFLMLAAGVATDQRLRGSAFNLAGAANLTTAEMCTAAIGAASVEVGRQGDTGLAASILRDGFQLIDRGEQPAREIEIQQVSGALLESKIGFVPSVPIAQGLEETASFYSRYLRT